MPKLFPILAAFACGVSFAQAQPPRQPLPQPSPPMVLTIKPPLGPASRASRHEELARERRQRIEDKVEDRADAEEKRKERRRALRRAAQI